MESLPKRNSKRGGIIMAKKERGIFERPKGSGIWWVRYADNFGRIHREKVGPKGLAKTVYAKRKLEVREGKFFPDNLKRRREMLFKDMMKLFIQDHSKPNKRSWRDDIYRAKPLVEVFGDRLLSEITTQDVERWKAKLAMEVSQATTNRYLTLLKTIFNKAVEGEKVKVNPAAKVKLFRENHRTFRFLTYEEEAKLKAVMDPDHWSLVELAIHTGLRRGEQFRLRWEDVDFQNRIITVHGKGGWVRHIPMNDKVMEILRRLPGRMKSEWLFPSKTNLTPLDAGTWVHGFFKPSIKKVGLNGFRWHDLRHSFASRLVMKGNDLKTVQELMGHRNIEMTLRYAHLSPAHKMSTVQTLVQAKNEGQSDTATDTTGKKAIEEKN
jgi:integrase